MKNLIMLWLLFLAMHLGAAPAPNVDFLAAEMAKRCVRGRASFNAIGTINNQVSFLTLELRDGAFHILTTNPLPNASDKKVDSMESSGRIGLTLLETFLVCRSNNVSTIIKHLEKIKVNTKIVSHGLSGYDPIFIIGAEPNDQTSPQLWIDKTTFLPVRQIVDEQVTVLNKPMSIDALGGKKIHGLITTTNENGVEEYAISEKIYSTPRISSPKF